MANIYRMLTPGLRSKTEQPLDYSVFETFSDQFSEVRHREFYLLSLGAVVFAFLRNKFLFDLFLGAVLKVDEWLFKQLPWLRRYAWITVIELVR